MSGECHKCPHGAAVARGDYSAVAFEETPCSKCRLEENSMRTLAYDAERGDERNAGPAGDESLAEQMPVEVLREALAVLLSQPPAVRDVVCWRVAGFKYREIAAVQGVTPAAVEARHKRALARCPVLRSLFPRKSGKQRMRKQHERRAA